MTEPVPLSTFVTRCQAALAEYQRLRGLGVSHDVAIAPLTCVLLHDKLQTRDVRQAQTGEAG